MTSHSSQPAPRYLGSAPLSRRKDYSEQAQRLAQEAGVRAVVLFTDDGLLAGRSTDFAEEAEKAAAMGTALFSSAVQEVNVIPGPGAAAEGGQRLRQVTLETFDGEFVILAQVDEGMRVVVYTEPNADLGSVSFGVARFAKNFSMSVPVR
ncbi:roadblock/LC7 domain-containing protein [Streptomyces sp. NBC_01727]|uniref:roadblock/LC7 domain-containing protein n=1 Tax=Streptomyces sp. NBC_01727 TaxID=2975924 RepID=UPI002E13272B|nr:roadblock/LC7 domain-containing protein [Streptomyces sp. NBC_01727]